MFLMTVTIEKLARVPFTYVQDSESKEEEEREKRKKKRKTQF